MIGCPCRLVRTFSEAPEDALSPERGWFGLLSIVLSHLRSGGLFRFLMSLLEIQASAIQRRRNRRHAVGVKGRSGLHAGVAGMGVPDRLSDPFMFMGSVMASPQADWLWQTAPPVGEAPHQNNHMGTALLHARGGFFRIVLFRCYTSEGRS